MSREELMEQIALEIFFCITGRSSPQYDKEYIIMSDCIRAARNVLQIISKSNLT